MGDGEQIIWQLPDYLIPDSRFQRKALTAEVAENAEEQQKIMEKALAFAVTSIGWSKVQ